MTDDLTRPISREVHARIVTITPDDARRLLARDDPNRSVSRARVIRYADDMRFGRWTISQPISIGTSGALLDGQHRLHAIVKAGTPVQMLVTYNVPDAARVNMDTGRKRNLADVLRMNGYRNTSIVAALARLLLVWDTGLTHGNHLTDAEIREYFETDPDGMAAAGTHAKHYATTIRTIPGLVIAATLYHTRSSDPSIVSDWWDGIALMSLNGRGDPRVPLMQRMSSSFSGAEGMRLTLMRLSLVTRAWNASARGEKVSQLRATSNNGEVIYPPKPVRWVRPESVLRTNATRPETPTGVTQ